MRILQWHYKEYFKFRKSQKLLRSLAHCRHHTKDTSQLHTPPLEFNELLLKFLDMLPFVCVIWWAVSVIFEKSTFSDFTAFLSFFTGNLFVWRSDVQCTCTHNYRHKVLFPLYLNWTNALTFACHYISWKCFLLFVSNFKMWKGLLLYHVTWHMSHLKIGFYEENHETSCDTTHTLIAKLKKFSHSIDSNDWIG